MVHETKKCLIVEQEEEPELREACLWCFEWNNGECKSCRKAQRLSKALLKDL